jgi:MoxR-like ATPase
LPFLVMATQNPIEMEGTYPLPEAQLDRFLMKIVVDYPSREELNRIVERTVQKEEIHLEPIMGRQEILELRAVCREILVAPHVQDFAVDLVMATQPGTRHSHPLADKYIRYGSSPRGAQALVECGRVHAALRGRAHLSRMTFKPSPFRSAPHNSHLTLCEGQTPDCCWGNHSDREGAVDGR